MKSSYYMEFIGPTWGEIATGPVLALAPIYSHEFLKRQRSWIFAWFIGMLASIPAGAAPQTSPALLVEEIVADSAAAKAGIKLGDRLLSYDDKRLTSAAGLQAAEDNTFGKEQVALLVERGAETLTLLVPLRRLGMQTRPELPPAALLLHEEGRTAQKANRTDQAVTKWLSAAKAAEEAGETAAAAWLYGRVGLAHDGRQQWKESCAAHSAAWTLLKQNADSAAQSRALISLGRCSERLNDFPAAMRWYERALELDSTSMNEIWMDSELNSLGNVALNRGDLTAAQDYFSRSLRIRERLAPNSLDLAGSLNNLGIATSRRGDLMGAQDYYHQSLVIKERLAPNSLTVAIALNNLGGIARMRGDLTLAQDYHNRSLAIKERLAPGSLDVAASLDNLGNVSRDRGDLAAAQDYHSRALAICERLAPNSLDVAGSLNNVGWVAYNLGDLAVAQDYHSRALAIRERLAPNSLDVATSLNNLGLVTLSLGDFQRAYDFHHRSLTIKERFAPNSLAVATSLNNLGLVAQSRGDWPVAQDFHSRALGIREKLAPDSLHVADSLSSLGGVAFMERRFSQALSLFTRAVAIVEAQRWRLRSSETRAFLMAQHSESFMGLLRTYVALNDFPSAFDTAERARARSLLEILSEARAEIRQGVDPALLQRESLLRQQLNARANRQTQLLAGSHTDEQAATAKNELNRLLLEYQEVQAEIRIKSTRYAALTQPLPLNLKEIQERVLDENTLLLEYVLGEAASYLFAVTPASVRCFELPKRAKLEQAARRVHQLLLARQPVQGETAQQRRLRIETADAEYPVAAAALSEMVLAPVAGQLSDQRLLVVADGALQYLPFGALPAPKITGQKPGSWEPLILKHEIVSLPSASAVAVLRRELQGRKDAENLVAVLADPVFDAEDPRVKLASQAQRAKATAHPFSAALERATKGAGLINDRGTLSRLPFTRDEAEAIITVAGGKSIKATDFNASRSTALSPHLSHYRIVHLATHGVLNTEHPELSGIVLSLVDEGGKPQDGFLRLHDVYNLNLPAELVVLSACQTGVGKEIKGEGLVGLTRGFMYAGARRVLASLWNVNDSVTAELMKRFYQGLVAKGLRPAAALRAAQVEMWRLKPTRSPYFWAAFVLQGEWR